MATPKSVFRYLAVVGLASMVVVTVLAGCVAVPYDSYSAYQNEPVYYGAPVYSPPPVVVVPRPFFFGGGFGGHHHHHWR